MKTKERRREKLTAEYKKAIASANSELEKKETVEKLKKYGIETTEKELLEKAWEQELARLKNAIRVCDVRNIRKTKRGEKMVTETNENRIVETDAAFLIITTPEPNFHMEAGTAPCCFCFGFYVKKTYLNRLKYWLFCRFFPFRITKWENK